MREGHRRLYATQRWRKLAQMVIRQAGGRCEVTEGCPHPATSCDHVVPAVELYEAGYIGEFFNPALLRASCTSCNSASGARLANRRRREQRRALTPEQVAEEWAARENRFWAEVERRRVAAEPRRLNPRID